MYAGGFLLNSEIHRLVGEKIEYPKLCPCSKVSHLWHIRILFRCTPPANPVYPFYGHHNSHNVVVIATGDVAAAARFELVRRLP